MKYKRLQLYAQRPYGVNLTASLGQGNISQADWFLNSNLFLRFHLPFTSLLTNNAHIFFLQILCENDDDVLVTLKEGKLFGEVSERDIVH